MNPNPYLTVDGCVDRLYQEYKKHPKLVLAVDYDDSVKPRHFEFDCSPVISAVKRAYNLGFYIVVYTAAEPERWPAMIEFMKEQGIEVAAVNKNAIELPYGNFGKIYYNLLLCDRAGLGQSLEVLNKLINKIEMKKFYKGEE